MKNHLTEPMSPAALEEARKLSAPAEINDSDAAMKAFHSEIRGGVKIKVFGWRIKPWQLAAAVIGMSGGGVLGYNFPEIVGTDQSSAIENQSDDDLLDAGNDAALPISLEPKLDAGETPVDGGQINADLNKQKPPLSKITGPVNLTEVPEETLVRELSTIAGQINNCGVTYENGKVNASPAIKNKIMRAKAIASELKRTQPWIQIPQLYVTFSDGLQGAISLNKVNF